MVLGVGGIGCETRNMRYVGVVLVFYFFFLFFFFIKKQGLLCEFKKGYIFFGAENPVSFLIF